MHRPQPGTNALPAAVVSPTPCHQPSLGTRLDSFGSHTQVSSASDLRQRSSPGQYVTGGYPRTPHYQPSCRLREAQVNTPQEYTHYKLFLETTLKHDCCLLNIPNTGLQKATSSLMPPFMTCFNTSLSSLIGTVKRYHN